MGWGAYNMSCFWYQISVTRCLSMQCMEAEALVSHREQMTLVSHSLHEILLESSLSGHSQLFSMQLVSLLKEKLNCVHDIEQEKIILQIFSPWTCNNLIPTDSSAEKKLSEGHWKAYSQGGLQTSVPTRRQNYVNETYQCSWPSKCQLLETPTKKKTQQLTNEARWLAWNLCLKKDIWTLLQTEYTSHMT